MTASTPHPTAQPTDSALTKAELVQGLVDALGLDKPLAKSVVEHFFGLCAETLRAGEELKVSGFGNFSLRDKTARPGRNPRTGQAVPIRPRRVVTFQPSRKLKAVVQAGHGRARPATKSKSGAE